MSSQSKTLPPQQPAPRRQVPALRDPPLPTGVGTLPSASMPEIPPPSVSPQVDQALGKALRAVLSKAWPAVLAAALGSGGAVLARPTPPVGRVDAQGESLSEARQRVSELESKVSDLEAGQRSQRRYDREQQSWIIEVLAAQNVHVRRPEGLADPTPVKTSSPLRKPKPPTLILDEPPALP